ncbi:TPA: hypothetical protein ACH3X1_004541 [Trebouxia sp. C0004]
MPTSLPASFCQFDQLLPVINLLQYSLPVQTAPAKQLDPWAAQQMYQNALHSAQATISQAWEYNFAALDLVSWCFDQLMLSRWMYRRTVNT